MLNARGEEKRRLRRVDVWESLRAEKLPRFKGRSLSRIDVCLSPSGPRETVETLNSLESSFITTPVDVT